MRLGQLARKYDVSLQEINSFIKKTDPSFEGLHHNSKLNADLESLLIKHFENPATEEVTEEEKISDSDVTPTKTSNTDESEEVRLEKSTPKSENTDDEIEDMAIQTDHLLEMLESEETPPVDISKITLIKAPKKELDGLKVVGKIDLPEPKTKKEESPEKEDQKSVSTQESKPRRKRFVSDEELEERRLKAKRKREQYEARQEKRRKEKEKKRKKLEREAFYQNRLQQSQKSKPKQNIKKKEQEPITEVSEPIHEPKTLYGKFIKWLNGY